MAVIFKLICFILFITVLHCCLLVHARDIASSNGDIYVMDDDDKSMEINMQKTKSIDMESVVTLCNSSFSIPMDYLKAFNTTGELPDVIDKTGMCFIRCFYEKSGLIDNWKLNTEIIRKYMWPATGDSIEFCEAQEKSEVNPCVRTYAIAKCLMIRALVDARN